MSLKVQLHAPWTEVCPTKTIVESVKPGRALVVDIGGSKGQDLEKFRLFHPEILEAVSSYKISLTLFKT